MKVNIVSKVDIEVTEQDLINILIEKIQTENPGVYVHGVSFDRKLNPTRIEITVDAQLNMPSKSEVIGNAAVGNVGSAKAIEEAAPFATEEVVEEIATAAIEKAETVGDLFS